MLRQFAWCLCLGSTGCAALTNPVANGIPVQLVPPELLGESKMDMEDLPLTLLRQPPPEAYRLAPEDLLGIWIEGILGEKGTVPPVHFSESGKLPPAMGFPIPVRADGTISLPYVDPIIVSGLTLEQVEQRIRKSYIDDKKIIQPGRERIFVTLQQQRQHHILVIRQDSGANSTSNPGAAVGGRGFIVSPGANVTGVRSGHGYAIDLPAYENDVLNALARTGGFPGTDAQNEIIIERGGNKKGIALPGEGVKIRIPLRYRRGEKPAIRPESIILQTGDVIYIEARQLDVYYTGGLLPPGKYLLPRDTDLDVIEAIIQAGGAINSGGVSALNVTGTTTSTTSSLGNPSPSLVTVLRRTPNGGQVAIRVDLNRAMRDPRERILIQPRDVLLMQETTQEALARYSSAVFRYTFAYQLLNSSRATSAAGVSLP